MYPVKVVPYDGYGCVDTFYARLADTLSVTAYAGPDMLSCNGQPVALGHIPKPGLSYSWHPADGLSDPGAANPFAAPGNTTSYVLTTASNGGGCVVKDTVTVKTSVIDNRLQLDGSDRFCSDSDDSAVLRVLPTAQIQWFRDDKMIGLANHAQYRAHQSGAYYALLQNDDGCSISTPIKDILIDDPRAGIQYPVEYAIRGLPLELKARPFGDKVLWSPGTWLNTQTSYTPQFTGNTDQLYTIEIRTRGNCLTVDTVLVKTIEKVEIHVPNAFTPNSDGRNDFLRPVIMGIRELRYFRVFNRWGKLLFDTKADQPGWDGSINGVLQPTQTVVWMAEGIGLDGAIHRRKGTAILLR